MRVVRTGRAGCAETRFDLRDDNDESVAPVLSFLEYLKARRYSPNTQSAYAHDLLHFFQFLQGEDLSWQEFRPPHAIELLKYLRTLPSRRPVKRAGLVMCIDDGQGSARRLAAATINRALAAVSSFYEYLIVSGLWTEVENPILKQYDPQQARVTDRHRPFMGYLSKQRPIRRAVRVKMPDLLPRPMSREQTTILLGSLRKQRDVAIVLLMLKGGLRPGEVLNLQLDDIRYGRRCVIVRYRTDHPKGARTKSLRERVVDLLEPDVLRALSDYVRSERPQATGSPHVFLVGGNGTRRAEPLGYWALVKLFERHCERLGIRESWVTPHALRHTHATEMWEGGMRELTLQKRLGHASPASTSKYTRVSDPVVLAEYRRAIGEQKPV